MLCIFQNVTMTRITNYDYFSVPPKPAKAKKSEEVDVEKAADGGKNHVGASGNDNHVNCKISPAPSVAVITPPKPVAPTPAPPPGPTKYFLMAAKIEKYAPRVVPLIFIAFTCLYWPYLLIASEYFHLSTDPEMYYRA